MMLSQMQYDLVSKETGLRDLMDRVRVIARTLTIDSDYDIRKGQRRFIDPETVCAPTIDMALTYWEVFLDQKMGNTDPIRRRLHKERCL